MTSWHLILGGPGAGKTRRLMEIVSQHLGAGVRPDRLAFVSFTRKAVREAQARASAEFSLAGGDLPYFRTLHSLCYTACNVRRDEVFGAKGSSHLADLARCTSCSFSTDRESPYDGTLGDRGLFLDGLARTSQQPMYRVWADFGEGVRWQWLKWFCESLRLYKAENCLVDYTGMLEKYLEEGKTLPVDVAIVDEAQDLSTLQWAVVRKAFADARQIYVAGDDLQAIYKWSGADVEQFLQLQVATTEVLPKSHRLSPEVYDYSQRLARRVQHRYDKTFEPLAGKPGRVILHRYLESVPVTNESSWLLLGRNKRLLADWKRHATTNGVLFSTKSGPSVDKLHIRGILDYERARGGGDIDGKRANAVLKLAGKPPRFTPHETVTFPALKLMDRPWYDVMRGIPRDRLDYYLAMRRRGLHIQDRPGVHIDTIHAVKGGEADQIAIISDMTPKTWKNLERDADDEYRVWYVGITRTRGDLHVVMPRTLLHYPV